MLKHLLGRLISCEFEERNNFCHFSQVRTKILHESAFVTQFNKKKSIGNCDNFHPSFLYPISKQIFYSNKPLIQIIWEDINNTIPTGNAFTSGDSTVYPFLSRFYFFQIDTRIDWMYQGFFMRFIFHYTDLYILPKWSISICEI